MRRAKDWTQAELGSRVGCTAAAIRKIEAEERFPSKQITGKLADVFGVPHNERERFQQFARGGAHRAPTAPEQGWEWKQARPAQRSNLPYPPTSLIGRTEEITVLREYLTNPGVRLIMLVGPPGIGKTRLSIAAAREAQAAFPDGVFFIPLSQLDNPSGDAQTIAGLVLKILEYVETGSLPASQQLTRGIREKEMLLVLDNCEHIITGVAAFASELLTACPRLKILATSRETLRIPGEWIYPVSPLPLPAQTTVTDAQASADELSGSPALALFAERARAVRPDFSISPGNIQAVAELCARVDGLPLGIELIAARVRWIPPHLLLARLDETWLLSADGRRAETPRQKTLNDAIGWSYSLLSAEEQRLFAHLSIFSGGFSLPAAEALIEQVFSGHRLHEPVGSLVEKSLVQPASAGGEPRFSMLRTIHQYASARLEQMGEQPAAQDWHLVYFLRLAEQADQHIHGADQLDWINRVERENDNIRAALHWSITQQKSSQSVRLLGALIWPWHERGHFREICQFFEQVRRLPSAIGSSDCERLAYARLLKNMGFLHVLYYNPALAQALLQESRERSEALTGAEAERNLAETLHWQGLLTKDVEGDAGTARSLVLAGLEHYQNLHDEWGIALSILTLGNIAVDCEDFQAGADYLRQSLSMLRELGDELLISRAYMFFENIYLKQGNDEMVRHFFNQHIEISERHQSWTYIVMDQLALGRYYHRQGKYEQASQLYERSFAVSEAHGLDPFESLFYHALLALDWEGPAEAEPRFKRLLNTVWKSGEREGICLSLAGIASTAAETGQPEQAAVLFGAVQALKEPCAARSAGAPLSVFDRYQQHARDQLGDALFSTLFTTGQGMSPEQAVAHALETR